jgi:ring-1,2-phenylacetyl-CoA epoxidase subunit PaaC
MSDSAPKIERATDLSPVLAEALAQWSLAVADTKLHLGLQFSHWVTGTPALEAAVGSAAMTQDELGHARGLFTLLRTLPNAPVGLDAHNDLQARTVYYAPPLLQQRWEQWLDIIVANVLLDRALHITIAATVGSAFAPLAGLAGKIVQEESFHRTYGDTWFTRLASKDQRIRTELQSSVDRLWALTTIWLGPPSDAASDLLEKAGILRMSAAQIRTRWLEQVTPLLEQNALIVPTITPNWSTWNRSTRVLEA